MEKHGPKLLGSSYKDPITSFSLFQKFSVQQPEVIIQFVCIGVFFLPVPGTMASLNSLLLHGYQAYWEFVLKEISVTFREAPKCILDRTDESKPGGLWLPGSVLNIAECCLLPTAHPRKTDDGVAIVWRDEGFDDSNVNHMTLKELREQVMYALLRVTSIFNCLFLCFQILFKLIVTYMFLPSYSN